MSTYIVNISDSFFEKAFLSFINSLGINAKKSKEMESTSSRLVEAEEKGDPCILFGKWSDLKIDPKQLRKKSW
jgi:hypothetical protein